ncbi:hypothetical protein HGP28_03025 [Vibrio sp. SM6]|uniref:Uncharacterized protein n=1 Tax=Vibrio agarilyticus TaxID=2726741 RepID=A0A7X8TPJ4_9VIBR|nr:hypothetical protein [Vibrio agarilyticus]NLS11863.1 hypothetical protein [Vibrio agarilyticus]
MKKYWLTALCFILALLSVVGWIWMDAEPSNPLESDGPNALEPFAWGFFILGVMTFIVAKLRK